MADTWGPFVPLFVREHIKEGLIFGDDGTIWANPKALKYDEADLKDIITQGFDFVSPVRGKSFFLDNKKYMITNTTDDFIHCKCLSGDGGIVIRKSTKKACLVGVYAEVGKDKLAVAEMDYLIKYLEDNM
ncbi:hypothetical protein IW140_002665 [Coemansia sp. RSA 1813]|nr:hypothetical protein EV178_000259 [Coemansia sp. RSA 1646]KAJ1772096.1 hypothetical protein LPJ74_001832 [Coemansia sp. RSA 1843]KAJ2090433.1 hypothetical protein IW138_002644 [Coemansia sp. RSA 986]KAJ2215400.1 hypothetical protein EV179_002184 [Coemansia sp. RSA 487]KAJ2569989.1 hypothetical protein IW140_002665 [Coemansia sp. RSA 1813]